jgi:predicted ester cyclase
MNAMMIIRINNGTYDEYRAFYDSLADRRASFTKNTIIGKVDDHTAIVTSDLFDEAGWQAMSESPDVVKRAEELGIEREFFRVQPYEG